MQYRLFIRVFPLLITGFISSCVDVYQPAIIENNPRYLVVNGILNCDGPTEISLTYSTHISSTDPPPPVSGALVEIQDDENNSYTLQETSEGTYAAGPELVPDTEKKYRLHILTSEQKEYLSEFVEVKRTRPIDSVSFHADEDGLDINISTHDPSGKSQYYKWNFTETWEYNARYLSLYRMVEDVLIPKAPAEYTYTCYRTVPNDGIVIESTVRLNEDRVSNFTLTTIPPASDKVSRKYSIIVQQYVLTEEAYQYMELLRNNTEQIGGLFDPLPSQIQGNIRCVSDADEVAIGFFIATSIEEKRVFIVPEDIPEIYPNFRPMGCAVDTTIFEPLVMYGSAENIITGIFSSGVPAVAVGFVSAPRECVDCRSRGGVVTKPDFWD